MKRAKPFVKPLSQRQLRAEAERLVQEGEMPSLSGLAQAVLSSRKRYAAKIRRARREAQLTIAVNKGGICE